MCRVRSLEKAFAFLCPGVEFELGSWEMLIQFLNDHGPAALIDHVRQAEDSDPRGERWPRTKRRDDASALLASFS